LSVKNAYFTQEPKQKDLLIVLPSKELIQLIKTQKGSKNIQNELSKSSTENIEILLNKICSSLPELMMDIYGNYFCQKVIKLSTPKDRINILKSVQKEFPKIAMNSSGTHSIQCLIESISTPEEEDILKQCVEKDFLKLSYDGYSTHAVQKILTLVKEESREAINKIILQNFIELVLDQNGICVAKKFVSGNSEQNIRKKILECVSLNGIDIIQNPFGNYIIQYMLDSWGVCSCASIINVIADNIVTLSLQKFSSNVVEKCLDMIDLQKRTLWCRELFININNFLTLVKNKYGNYVLNRALQKLSFHEKKELKESMNNHLLSANIHRKDKNRIKEFVEVI